LKAGQRETGKQVRGQTKEKIANSKRLSVRMESMETLLLLMQMDIERPSRTALTTSSVKK